VTAVSPRRLDFVIRVTPPSTTAQQKRMNRKTGAFFQPEKMKREEQTWAAVLWPHKPAGPITGAVEMVVVFVYPHLKGTNLRDRCYLLPKETRPDCDNAAKHLIDLLSRMRFIEDDAKIARLVVEKYHGPEAQVGIRIAVQPMYPSVPSIESPTKER